MELLAVFTNTAQVLDIDYDADRDEVLVQTTGGVERYAPDGEWLGLDPTTPVRGRPSAPFEGGLLEGGGDGVLRFRAGEQVVEWDLGCPIVDIEGGSGLGSPARVACLWTAFEFTWRPEEVAVPASAASPDGWGLLDGAVMDERGLVGRVPGRVTALEKVGEAWFVGTADGLYLLGEGTRRLTPEGQICGNFVTGTALFEGDLVVSTFDRGACRWDGRTWTPVPLPTHLVNDVAVYDGSLWFATGSGLVRSDGREHQTLPAGWGLQRGAPGTHHAALNDVAVGERFWSVDLLGPVSVDDQGLWRRHRFSVFGTSHQALGVCGDVALSATEDAGLALFDGRRWTQHDANNGLPDDWVMAVECLDADAAWAGLYDDGLWFWDGRRWTEQPTPDSWILSLEATPQALFVGTMGGLYVGEEPVWSPDPRIHHLAAEGDRLFVGTEGGLAVYAL